MSADSKNDIPGAGGQDGRPAWMKNFIGFSNRVTTPMAAFNKIRRGDTIFVASACAEPQYLLRKLAEYAPRLSDVEVIHLLGSGETLFDDPKYIDRIRFNCFFIGSNTRAAVARGQADYTPACLSEIPVLMRKKQLRIDVALIQVAPPNERGMCCLGVSVETVKAAVENARYVIAQVNPRMPVVGGDSCVPIERLDALILHEEDLLEFTWPAPGDLSEKIAYHVSRLVEDEATLQIGIGKIPSAILRHLKNRRDLGIHTEMFTDSLIDLIEEGVVTGKRKGMHEGVVVASFCVGTKRLYEYIHNNPTFELYPADYASDPGVISRNNKMTAINGALEVDLTGQVCADSIGHRFYSGFGSQVDFMRGAARSEGGKPIIVLPSTAKNGSVSRIVPTLSPGAGVVLTRSDVHYVVTEYGIAYLYGKSIRERALALIEIAHPKFREELLRRAKAMHYIYADQELPSDCLFVYPDQFHKEVELANGLRVTLRPIRPRDEPLLQELYYSLSDKDLFLRFMGNNPCFPHSRVQCEAVVDYRDRMAIVATIGREGKERIVGAATYDVIKQNDVAECSFTVKEDYRCMGVGRAMLLHLQGIAKECGNITGFRVEVLAKNKPMLNLFYHGLGERRSRDCMHTHLEDGVYSLWYKFTSEE